MDLFLSTLPVLIAIACPGHDSSVSIAYPGADSIVYTIKLTSLPLLTLAWTSENSLIAAGHDCQPLVFSGSHDGWELSGTLDDPNANKTGSGAARAGLGGASPVGRLNSAAFNTFRNADSRGISNVPGSSGPSAESELFTVHQNTITSVRAYEGAPGDVARVSTSGVDGKLVVWDVAQVSPISVTSNIVGRLAGVRI